MTDIASTQTRARDRLAALTDLAVDTLAELAEGAERDNVRLAAAEAILDRVGLGRGVSVSVSTSSEEAHAVTLQAQALIEALERNHAGTQPVLARVPELEVLVVLESESEELPVAVPVPGAIEV